MSEENKNWPLDEYKAIEGTVINTRDDYSRYSVKLEGKEAFEHLQEVERIQAENANHKQHIANVEGQRDELIREMGGFKLDWHKGPAEGGTGTAPDAKDGKDMWWDGDTLLVIVETNKCREIVVLNVSADEDDFSVTDCYGDYYSDWGPECWSWWAKLDKNNLPEPKETND